MLDSDVAETTLEGVLAYAGVSGLNQARVRQIVVCGLWPGLGEDLFEVPC